MDNDTPSQDTLSSLLRRGPDQVPARGELVWNEEGGVTNAATQAPRMITAQDLERMHGNDERVPIESLVSGLKMITDTVLDVAGKK